MKVVLFCGGQGLRMGDLSLSATAQSVPKPMATIGTRPVLWHVMRYYAHFGHRDFVLCLGYRGDVIKDYFRHYDETVSNDFVMSGSGEIELLNQDIQDWRIALIDTGPEASVGQRLLAVKAQVEDESIFLANYADGLTDAPLDELIEDFARRDAVAGFVAVRPPQTFHVLSVREDGSVEGITHVRNADIWMNGGYFMFRSSIFDYLRPGEELVEEPFQRLIEQGRLISYRHDGFWRAMDTLKEMNELRELYESGRSPWTLWQQRDGAGG
jgi:glucose-1-phosphate cytidylyltransferase